MQTTDIVLHNPWYTQGTVYKIIVVNKITHKEHTNFHFRILIQSSVS